MNMLRLLARLDEARIGVAHIGSVGTTVLIDGSEDGSVGQAVKSATSSACSSFSACLHLLRRYRAV